MNILVAEETLTIEQLRKFFEDRPALKPNAIGIEAGLVTGYLNKIVNGDRPLNDEVAAKVMTVIKKYGYGLDVN
ncbi:MAG TPA: DeoR family transcriptional regulator [Microscillaceae bacterium]|nr:DeoR family transcriptional regulator [Microscillaceae bacterium]